MAATSHPMRYAIRLDADLLDAFKSTGKGWQTRMNAALRQFITEHPLRADKIRHILPGKGGCVSEVGAAAAGWAKGKV